MLRETLHIAPSPPELKPLLREVIKKNP